jgi:hypothetical protein
MAQIDMNPVLSWGENGEQLLTFTSNFLVDQFPATAHLYPGQTTFTDRITVSAHLFPAIWAYAKQQMVFTQTQEERKQN